MVKSRNLAANFMLFIFSVIFMFLILEAILSFTKYKYVVKLDPHPPNFYKNNTEAGYDIQENFSEGVFYSPSDFFEFKVWSNNLGCFDTPYRNEEKFVLFVGDSHTFGLVPHQNSWGQLLEKTLGFRFLKCGVPGYGTRQALAKTKKVVSQTIHTPKLILLGYYINDFTEDYHFPMRKVDNGYLVVNMEMEDIKSGRIAPTKYAGKTELFQKYCIKEPPKNPTIQSIKCWLNKNSISYNIFKERIRNLVFKFPVLARVTTNRTSFEEIVENRSGLWHSAYSPKEFPWVDGAWKTHLNNLKAFKEYADEIEAKLLIVMIPDKRQVYPFLNPVNDMSRVADIERPNAILQTFFKKEKIDYLDLLPSFRRYSNQNPRKWLNREKDIYYKIDDHLNIKGNNLMRLLVGQYILERELLGLSGKEKKLSTVINQLENFS